MLFLIELDWIFIFKKWIRILDSMFDSIWFDFGKGSYQENLIEIYRNSDEKLIWLKLFEF